MPKQPLLALFSLPGKLKGGFRGYFWARKPRNGLPPPFWLGDEGGRLKLGHPAKDGLNLALPDSPDDPKVAYLAPTRSPKGDLLAGFGAGQGKAASGPPWTSSLRGGSATPARRRPGRMAVDGRCTIIFYFARGGLNSPTRLPGASQISLRPERPFGYPIFMFPARVSARVLRARGI